LLVSLLGNLGLLGYFKYANFFIENFRKVFDTFGISFDSHLINVILPVGISFYTFQTLSYSLDIYFGRMKPTDSLLKFMVFVAAFPQLVAGPIVRARELLPQLNNNLYKRSCYEGVFYIIYGFLKKLLLADFIGHYIVDPVFEGNISNYSSIELILVAYSYAFQIFFDFSAYSDIAIGLGKIFGLELPINFKFPYTSMNPSEFWRKWHITLSTWFRDYLYIPLGGNRGPRFTRLRNLMIVMLLVGLWHGANWTFVFWGVLHGIYLVVYRFAENLKIYQRIPNYLKIFIFFNLVCLAWIFFRAPNIEFALTYLKEIIDFSVWHRVDNLTDFVVLVLLAISIGIHYFVEPRLKYVCHAFMKMHWSFHAIIVFLLFGFFSYLGEKEITHRAFIYFQF